MVRRGGRMVMIRCIIIPFEAGERCCNPSVYFLRISCRMIKRLKYVNIFYVSKIAAHK